MNKTGLWIAGILLLASLGLTGAVARAQEDGQYDGLFWVILETDSKTAPGGVMCAGARGHLRIDNGVISGTLISDMLMPFEVSGLIDHSGRVTGGLAITPTSAETALFEDGDAGAGTWSYLGCTGTHRSWKVPENPEPGSDLLSQMKLREGLCENDVYLDCFEMDTPMCEYTYDAATRACRTLNSTVDIDTAATARLLTACIANSQVRSLPVEIPDVNRCLAAALAANPEEQP